MKQNKCPECGHEMETCTNLMSGNAVFYCNRCGFAIAMREPPQTTEEIRKVSSALDEIIEERM
jgi:transcription elongation factor Elf1